jgi:hypothetical protein
MAPVTTPEYDFLLLLISRIANIEIRKSKSDDLCRATQGRPECELVHNIQSCGHLKHLRLVQRIYRENGRGIRLI